MKIDVILRTHDGANVHPIVRVLSNDKQQIVWRTLNSIVKAINHSRNEISLTVLDDHSSPETLEVMHRLLDQCRANIDFVALAGKGNNFSMLESFTRAKMSSAELVYCVEDDYIHLPEAIDCMASAHELFKKNLGREVVLHPIDDPHQYRPEFMKPCMVVLGPDRHWRTADFSACTILSTPELFRNNWPPFERMATLYGTPRGQAEKVHEGTTIAKIYEQRRAHLFMPLSPLAIHLNEWPQHLFDNQKLWQENEVVS